MRKLVLASRFWWFVRWWIALCFRRIHKVYVARVERAQVAGPKGIVGVACLKETEP